MLHIGNRCKRGDINNSTTHYCKNAGGSTVVREVVKIPSTADNAVIITVIKSQV